MPREEEIKAAFHATIQKHGHAYQSAIYSRLLKLCAPGLHGWMPKLMEFPVSVGNKETHIDFILWGGRAGMGGLCETDPMIFFVVECKRADPARSSWCFARDAETRGREGGLSGDYMRFGKDGYYSDGVRIRWSSMNTYSLAYAIRTRETTGDGTGHRANEITAAVCQSLLGANGLIGTFGDAPSMMGANKRCIVLAAVITTAKLFVTDADLTRADPTTGQVDVSLMDDFRPEPFVLFDYNLSPSYKHSRSPRAKQTWLQNLLDREYRRTVMIINAAEIEQFVRKLNPLVMIESFTEPDAS